MKILIVDDEVLARKKIVDFLSSEEQEYQLKEASSGKEAIDGIITQAPDLVFLDIQMTDMSGFDVIRSVGIHNMPLTVFVTAFDDFAIRAFEVQALDFLLKPYKKSRFFEALERAEKLILLKDTVSYQSSINEIVRYMDKHDSLNTSKTKEHLDRIVIKIGKKYHFVDVKEIKFITSAAYYAEIFTFGDRKHVIRISMTDLLKKLDPNSFLRINRSTIVSIKEIFEVVSEGYGDYSAIMHDRTKFRVTKKYKNEFLKKMNISKNSQSI